MGKVMGLWPLAEAPGRPIQRGLVRGFLLGILICGTGAPATLAQQAGETPAHPASGTIASPLAEVEAEILAFMAEREIPGAVFALAREGELLAERGYGWRDRGLTEPLPADARLRIASVSKPVVAATVRMLVREDEIAMTDHAFDVGQPRGGILPVNPFPALADYRLGEVTVQHLLDHRGGWDRSEAGDWTFREVTVAQAMGLNGSPGRENLLDYILGQALQFSPGERESYSNIGYLALGLIVEHVSGQDLMTVVDQRVLGPLGISNDEYLQGATFKENQHPGEPFYHAPEQRINVFDPEGPRVDHPYGGWDHEMRIGQGGHIATARALVAFMSQYFIAGPNMGAPIPPTAGSGWRWNHRGSLPGTTALARQRGDGINYAIIFNQRGDSDYASHIRDRIDAILDSGIIDWDNLDGVLADQLDGALQTRDVEVRLALLAEQRQLIDNSMLASMDSSLMSQFGLSLGSKIEVGAEGRSALYTVVESREEGADVLRMGRTARQRLGQSEPFEGHISRVEEVRVERALFSLGLHDVVGDSGAAAMDQSLMLRLELEKGDHITLRPKGRVDEAATFEIVEILNEGESIVRIGLTGRQRLDERDPFVGYLSLARGGRRP